jgi:hypothetical protein
MGILPFQITSRCNSSVCNAIMISTHRTPTWALITKFSWKHSREYVIVEYIPLQLWARKLSARFMLSVDDAVSSSRAVTGGNILESSKLLVGWVDVYSTCLSPCSLALFTPPITWCTVASRDIAEDSPRKSHNLDMLICVCELEVEVGWKLTLYSSMFLKIKIRTKIREIENENASWARRRRENANQSWIVTLRIIWLEEALVITYHYCFSCLLTSLSQFRTSSSWAHDGSRGSISTNYTWTPLCVPFARMVHTWRIVREETCPNQPPNFPIGRLVRRSDWIVV